MPMPTTNGLPTRAPTSRSGSSREITPIAYAPSQLLDREPHRVDERAAVRLQRLDQVRDHFGVGLGVELGSPATVSVRANLLEVLDDAVVHHADPIARHVRMRVALDRRTVRRPARVRDPDVPEQRLRVQAIGELFDLADPAPPFDAPRAVRNHGETRGIVAAVFEPPESLDENSRNVPARDGAHDAAHT